MYFIQLIGISQVFILLAIIAFLLGNFLLDLSRPQRAPWVLFIISSIFLIASFVAMTFAYQEWQEILKRLPKQ